MPRSVAGPPSLSKGREVALLVRLAPSTPRLRIPRAALYGVATPEAWLKQEVAYPWSLGYALAGGQPWLVQAPSAYLWGRAGKPRSLLLLAEGRLALAAERVLAWTPLATEAPLSASEDGALLPLPALLADPAFNPFCGAAHDPG